MSQRPAAQTLLLAALWVGCGARTPLALDEPVESASPSVPDAPATNDTPQTPPRPPRSAPPPAPPPPDEPGCTSFTVTIDELRPAVTLLVDQSGSMNQPYPDEQSPQTRWQVVRQALLDERTGVVKSFERSIQFGLVLYTSHNGFMGGMCPILNKVRSATNNHAAISALYDSMWPDDDTPTGPAITQVVKEIEASSRKGPEVILLVTDGDPDTCTQPDPQDGQAEATSAAAAAHAAGIGFYVLGISTDISGHKLQQLANAGQGRPINALWGVDAAAAEPFEAARSVGGLSAQLEQIIDRVPLCELELERSVTVEDLEPSSVVLDGKALVHGDPNGFRLKSERRLEVVGDACKNLRASGKLLEVRIACE
jgi:hypothetical protein